MAPRSRKQKGTEAETAVRRFVSPTWPLATRLPPAGHADVGDIGGVPHTVIQVKNWRELALAGWVDEAAKQATTAGKPLYAVVHKRPRKGDAGDWYVTMPLKVFVAGWKP